MIDRGIYLASRSPRRRELLAQIGVRYHLLLTRAREGRTPDVDESPLAGEAPRAYVERMVRIKADAGWKALVHRNLPRAPVLAADTTVTVDGRILGKPADRDEAAAMLRMLSGRVHEVLSAVALKDDERLELALSVSEVSFRSLTAQEIAAYIDTGEPWDKAGAYAIQGRAARFVSGLRGSYSGVVGLPLYETAELLDRFVPRTP